MAEHPESILPHNGSAMTQSAAGCYETILERYHGEILCFTASKLAASIGWDAVNKAIATMRKHDLRAVADGNEQLGSRPIFLVWPDADGDYLTIGLYSQTPTKITGIALETELP